MADLSLLRASSTNLLVSSVRFSGTGGKVLSPWNTSPELPSGWVGVPAKMCYYLRVITQGIFKENGDKRLEISTIPGIF